MNICSRRGSKLRAWDPVVSRLKTNVNIASHSSFVLVTFSHLCSTCLCPVYRLLFARRYPRNMAAVATRMPLAALPRLPRRALMGRRALSSK